jgi:uncharacterized protein YuzE
VRLIYDSRADVLSLRLRSAKIGSSEDLDDGVTLILDDDGRVMGVDFSKARSRLTLEELTTVSYENAGTKQRATLKLP